jgi:hypothetical protein
LSGIGAGPVQRGDGEIPLRRTVVTFHVQRDTLPDVFGGADGADAALGFAEAALGAFDGIGRGRQQSVVQEGQCLLQIGREQFVERAADPLEAADPLSQAGQRLRRQFLLRRSTRAGGRSSTREMPSLESATYCPGPTMAVPPDGIRGSARRDVPRHPPLP